MEVKGTIQEFLRQLISILQVAKMYTTDHPRFESLLPELYAVLDKVIAEQSELRFGIVGDELVFGQEVFFELSKNIRQELAYLKKKGIEKIVFLKGVSQEELKVFVATLVLTEEGKDLNEQLRKGGVTHIILGKISAGSQQSTQAAKVAMPKVEELVDSSVKSVEDSLQTLLDGRSLDADQLRKTITNVMENLMGQYHELLKLTAMRKYDTLTYLHLLDVAILSMFFASKLGFSKEDVLDIGIAGLFHDIGKVHISRKITSKEGGLTTEEFAKMKSHAILGSELLLRYIDSLGILPVVVAFEHHLKYDGSGYPKLKFFKKQNIASSIVSICDVYDALTQRRSYKRDYPPNMVYGIMNRERGTSFSPELLDEFFKLIGIWPKGTIVKLDNDYIGVVTAINPDDIASPTVKILSPADKRGESADLARLKGQLMIIESLNPMAEGKQYLQYIE